MRWFRPAGIALCVIGISLLGGASPAPDVDPLVLGRIEIPRIGISAIVREGDDDGTLSFAVGHVPGTARPGESGNVVLAGRCDSFFRALPEVGLDDVIHFRAPDAEHRYRVDSIEMVRPDETRALDGTGDSAVTLVTRCPFGTPGSVPMQFVVHAARLAP